MAGVYGVTSRPVVWCVVASRPCAKILPFFSSLSRTHAKVTLLTVDVDDRADISARYSVSVLPTFVMVVRGAEVGRYTGSAPLELERAVVAAERAAVASPA